MLASRLDEMGCVIEYLLDAFKEAVSEGECYEVLSMCMSCISSTAALYEGEIAQNLIADEKGNAPGAATPNALTP
ncbi:MAG: hypothetical protein LBH66_08985 [Oscillospiraceae bacterium]|jgi:hypothetical protein|nr:hypothetical protein [Oscillospiraceae bacterium]